MSNIRSTPVIPLTFPVPHESNRMCHIALARIDLVERTLDCGEAISIWPEVFKAVKNVVAAVIQVNAVSPAVVLTPFWEQNLDECGRMTGKGPEHLSETWESQTSHRRIGTVEDITILILFLAGLTAHFVTSQHINACCGFVHTS